MFQKIFKTPFEMSVSSFLQPRPQSSGEKSEIIAASDWYQVHAIMFKEAMNARIQSNKKKLIGEDVGNKKFKIKKIECKFDI